MSMLYIGLHYSIITINRFVLFTKLLAYFVKNIKYRPSTAGRNPGVSSDEERRVGEVLTCLRNLGPSGSGW